MSNDAAIARLRLGITLRECRIRHLEKLGALAAAGTIVGAIHEVDSEAVRDGLGELNKFTSEAGRNSELYFSGWMLINLVAEVEMFLLDVSKSILLAYPKKLGKRTVDLVDVIDKSREEIVEAASGEFLNSLVYKKPREYIASLCEVWSLDEAVVSERWITFVEVKARRDLGIHNDWKVNETYLRKLAEAGIEHQVELGQDLCPSQEYLQAQYDVCSGLVELLYQELLSKHARE